MTDNKKDVVIHVTGVSMSGGVRNDDNRPVAENKRKGRRRGGERERLSKVTPRSV